MVLFVVFFAAGFLEAGGGLKLHHGRRYSAQNWLLSEDSV
jgi:hypothetical protein